MHKLYALKDRLVKELEEYGSKNLSDASLKTIDSLAHAAKNVGKVIECCEEEEYSNRGYSRRGMSYDDGGYSSDGNYVRPDGSYRREIVDSSYARGRGRGAKRDSMGRYSRDGRSYRGNSYGYSRDGKDEYKEQLMQLMDDAPDENTRQSIKRMLDSMN